MTAVQHSGKKTGYQDIDEILIDVHELILEGEQLQKEIAEALKFQPRPLFRSKTKDVQKQRLTISKKSFYL